MTRPNLEVADVFHRYGDAFRRRFSTSLTTAQRRAMSAIEHCRTAALGGQIEQCDHCGHRRFCYRSSTATAPSVRPLPAPPQASLRTRLPLLPPRLYPPSAHRRPRPAEPTGVYTLLLAHPRLRPQTPWRRDRLLRRPAFVGSGSSAAPSPALRRPRRRHRSPRRPLDLLPPRLLPPRSRPLPPVPPPLPRTAPAGQIAGFRHALSPLNHPGFRPLPPAPPPSRVGRLRHSPHQVLGSRPLTPTASPSHRLLAVEEASVGATTAITAASRP